METRIVYRKAKVGDDYIANFAIIRGRSLWSDKKERCLFCMSLTEKLYKHF